MLTVYHGSTYCVEQPLAGICRPNLDFGIGFYVTDLQEQAARWALRTAETRHKNQVWLNTYNLDIDVCLSSAYRYLHFGEYNADWLDFVVDCRKGGTLWKAYDIIEGGIADDRVIRTIDLYISGDYSRNEALNRLIHQETNNQTCIISQEVIESHLHFVEASRLPNLSLGNPEPNAVDVVMQGKYFSIVEQLSIRLHISSKKALDIFYNTDTYKRLTQRVGDLYLMSDLYILDEVIRELQTKQ